VGGGFGWGESIIRAAGSEEGDWFGGFKKGFGRSGVNSQGYVYGRGS